MTLKSDYPLHQPPIFVCGIQRAGTTLLVKMLSKSDSIDFLPQETHLYPLLWNWKGKLKDFKQPKEWSDYLRVQLPKVNYGWVTAMPFLELICETIEVNNFMPNSVEELLEFILKIKENQQGKVYIGEKTPAHIYYALKKRKKFPQCKIIIMCRDPRAAALSELIKLNNNPRVDKPFNVFTFLVRWASAIALSKRLSKLKNVLFLKYEDLIEDPQATLIKATEFLNVSFQRDMLNVGVTNSSFQDSAQIGIAFNQQNLSRWESELPIEMLTLIEYHLAHEMKTLGYTLSSNGSPNVANLTLIKQRIKLVAAKNMATTAPALFHHLNRNKKYRNE